MSDEWAARLQDPLIHTSWLGELVSWATEALIYGAAAFAVTCFIACPVVALGVGLVAGAVMGTAAQSTGIGKKITEIADSVGNWVSPPEEMGFISTASRDTRTNSRFSARAAGKKVADIEKIPETGPSTWDSLKKTLWGMTPMGIVEGFIDRGKAIADSPVVKKADPGTEPADEDCVFCERHTNDSFSYMINSVFDFFTGNDFADEFSKTSQYIAQGSEEVNINGQPAGRSNMKTTCEGDINENYQENKISPDVRIGGETITVRDITSGKNKWVQAATMVLDAIMIVRGIAKIKGGCGKGNPVMVNSGTKLQWNESNDLDFQLPSLLPIVWQRNYNSASDRVNTLLGRGWSFLYECEIRRIPHPEEGELWLYYDDIGRQLELGNLKQGSYLYVPEEKLCITQITPSLTVIEDVSSGMLSVFDKDPHNPNRSRLLRLSDRNGNHLDLSYYEDGRIDRISDNEQRIVIQLNYHDQHLNRLQSVERLYLNNDNKEIVEKSELLVSYELTEYGDLKTVKNQESTVLRQFTYNTNRKMASHTQPAGNTCYYEWALYDVPSERIPKTLKAPQPQQEWRVTHHWTDAGEEYFFDYDLAKGETKVTDGLGRTELYYWNEYQNVYEQIDALGNKWLDEWKDGLLAKRIDPSGNTWQFQYNEYGHEIEATDPLGRTQYTYYNNYKGLPSRVIDFNNNAWYYYYDHVGNLIKVIDPLQHTTLYEYDPRGLMIHITDAAGKEKMLRWSSSGQLIQYRDCSGYHTYYKYDQRGFLEQVINELNQATTYKYDLTGFLTQITLADERVIRYQRNKIGLITGYIDPVQNITQYKYNLLGSITQRIDAQGRSVGYHYDDYGRLTALTNENKESYRFEWDVLDRLMIQHELDGGARRYYYNNSDQVIGIDYIGAPIENDPRKRVAANDSTESTHIDTKDYQPIISHRFERDPIGRLIKKITDDGITEYSYDKNDNLISIVFTDSQGKKQALAYTYDELGQLQSEINNFGNLKYSYDELGNLEQFTLPDGRNLNHLYYGSSYLHQINLDGLIIADFERDRLHQEILRTQGQLNTHTKYDKTGRLIRRQISQPQQKQQNILPLLEKAYQYDGADNLIAEHFTQYQRSPQQGKALADRLGQKLPLEPHGLQDIKSQQTDNPPIIGRLFAQNAANTTGTQRSEVQLNISQNGYQATRYYNYDSTGRILQSYQNTPQGQAINYEILHYDAAANLLNGDTSQGYVKHNRIQVYQDKRYYYDRFGRLAEKRIGGHTIQYFKYDAEHRITEIKHTQHQQIKYIRFKYDPIGRRIEKATYLPSNLETPIAKTEFYWQGMRFLGEKQNGLTRYYIYDNGYNLLACMEGEKGKEKVSYFHNNLAGLPEQLTDKQGNTTWQADYEIWGNITNEWKDNRNSFDQNLRYQGQYLDRETGLHYNTFRYYDPDIGRFTQPDPIGLLGGFNLYQYAPNPISWVDPWGWACIKNKVDGIAREKRAQKIFERRYGKDNVLSERYLRDANGKIVRDPITGEGRRVDFVIKNADGKTGVAKEVTSKTADKTAQLTKEDRIRQAGGVYVRDPKTRELIKVDNVSDVYRAK